jgi:hypothetical protein
VAEGRVNTQLLIDAVVQQTMVFIAQLATAGGVRAPLAKVAGQVFLDLTSELQNQGVKKKVIADMFGMALRTYHRRTRELKESQTDVGRTLWDATLAFVREQSSCSALELQRRFRHDDAEILRGILGDLVNSGLVFRSGRGDGAIYRIVGDADLAAHSAPGGATGLDYMVWLAVYQSAPLTLAALTEVSKVSAERCEAALKRLILDGRVRRVPDTEPALYESKEFDVPFGEEQGWEAAVLDHFRALVTAVGMKLAAGRSSAEARDTVGGSTFSFDVVAGAPLEREALGILARHRAELEELRRRVDLHNSRMPPHQAFRRVVHYMGQYVRDDGDARDPMEGNE